MRWGEGRDERLPETVPRLMAVKVEGEGVVKGQVESQGECDGCSEGEGRADESEGWRGENERRGAGGDGRGERGPETVSRLMAVWRLGEGE